MSLHPLSSSLDEDIGLPNVNAYSTFYLIHQRSLEITKRVSLVALGIIFSAAYTHNYWQLKSRIACFATPLLSVFDFSKKDKTENLIKQAFALGRDCFYINFSWYLFKYIIQACRLPTHYQILGKKILEHPHLDKREKALAIQRYYAFIQALLNRRLSDPLSSKDLVFLKLVAAFPRGYYAPFCKKQNHAQYLDELNKLWDERVVGQDNLKKYFINSLYGENCHPGSYPNRTLAFQGPTGVGKTHLVTYFLQQATQRPVINLPLTSITSLDELIGSESRPGLLIQHLIDCKVANPIFFFDELDKQKNPAILEFFTQLCDPIHHKEYRDRFLKDFAIDLSKASFIFAFNNPSSLPDALLDRCKRLFFQPLDLSSKVKILQKKYALRLEKYSQASQMAAKDFLLKQNPSMSLRQLSITFEDYLLDKGLY